LHILNKPEKSFFNQERHAEEKNNIQRLKRLGTSTMFNAWKIFYRFKEGKL
jgi:hypothetical protein